MKYIHVISSTVEVYEGAFIAGVGWISPQYHQQFGLKPDSLTLIIIIIIMICGVSDETQHNIANTNIKPPLFMLYFLHSTIIENK